MQQSHHNELPNDPRHSRTNAQREKIEVSGLLDLLGRTPKSDQQPVLNESHDSKSCSVTEQSKSSAKTFGTHSHAYTIYRPTYPKELISYLSSLLEDKDVALDCGTGSGQAVPLLEEEFKTVHAFDISERLIALAPKRENYKYQVSSAENFEVADNSVDLFFAGNAAHWFDHDKFCPRVIKAGKEGSIVAYAGYNAAVIVTPEIQEARDRFLEKLLPFEARGNHIVNGSYQFLSFPFEEITAPQFAIENEWTYQHLINFWSTMAPVIKAIAGLEKNPLKEFQDEISEIVNLDSTFTVKLPLLLRVGRIIHKDLQ